MSGNEKWDRELESFLVEENSRVAALYRKLPRQEPDAKLDEAVLALARFAVAKKRPRNYWMPALSAAAITLLVVGVSYRTALRQWNERATVPSQMIISEPVATPSPSAPEAQAFPAVPAPVQPSSAASNAAPKPATAPPASDALARRKTTDLPRAEAAPSREAIARPQAESKAMEKRADKSADIAPPTSPVPSAPLEQLDATVSTRADLEKQTAGAGVSNRVQAEQPLRKTESLPSELQNVSPSSAAAPSAPPPASAPSPATMTYTAAAKIASDAHLYPEHWIANIQQLLRDDKRDEAIRDLNEFRNTYPDYPLPDDLRNLK